MTQCLTIPIYIIEHFACSARIVDNLTFISMCFILLINFKLSKIVDNLSIISMNFILLINVKMSIVGILTFMSMINTTSESFKARRVFIFQNFSFYEHMKFPASVELNI